MIIIQKTKVKSNTTSALKIKGKNSKTHKTVNMSPKKSKNFENMTIFS